MKISVLGAGESGVGSAILAIAKGHEVFVSDAGQIKDKYKDELVHRGIEFEQGAHSEERILASDLVIKSPGIPEKAPLIKALRQKGVKIISEIEFAAQYTSAKTICITGSNGKTTTTMLTYHILQQAGLNVGLAGNVGKSFAWQVAEAEHDYYVIELSSFQLDGMYDFRADVAILLNITPDHLDRYDYQFQNYINSKFRILQNMTSEQHFIYWSGDPVLQREIAARKIEATMHPFALEQGGDAWVDNNTLNINCKNILSMLIDELPIKGSHNIYNSMAASISAQIVGISNPVLRAALRSFQGVEHRLEYVATIRDVRYVNDSKATNVNSCWYALQSMQTPVVLILGGTDKGNDYTEILNLVREKVHTLVFMGLDNKKLNDFFRANTDVDIVDTNSLSDAVEACYRAARPGDTVLLSPCCASFDLFKNYEDRGRKFKDAVKAL